MHPRSEINRLAFEIHHLRAKDSARFQTLKQEVLNVLRALQGEDSRAYRVVKWTSSPATMSKVIDFVSGRRDTGLSSQVANM